MHGARRRLSRLTTPPDVDRVLAAIGRAESRWARSATLASITDAEFRVFSQFGEDGIIQYLLGRVPIPNEQFVEIGVDDYREANTRFLLVNDNWKGLIVDGGTEHLRFLAESGLDWRHTIEGRQVFVTCDNVNAVLTDAGLAGDIGLLSIDIDGNDYWIWEAIEVVSPRIVVIEYNAVFGSHAAVTVPYEPKFVRHGAHSSGLYFGASLPALDHLGRRKGYTLVGSNRNGNNAFFVRGDVVGDLPRPTAADAWRESRFRESRGADGALTFVGPIAERAALIDSLPLVDVVTGSTTSLRQLPDLKKL